MSKRIPNTQAAIAGAVGSAAVAAALLYVSWRRERRAEDARTANIPGGEPPESD